MKEKNNNKNIVKGTDIFTVKSDQASVEKSYGYPRFGVRCCENNPYTGTHTEMLTSEPASISGYGFAHYSNFKNNNLISDKNQEKINMEIEKYNINVEDIFDIKYRQKKLKK
jgi:hypothetical protein